MRYAAGAQQTEVSKQSLHATISNLDTEPALYNPDSSLAFAASPTPTLRSARLASAAGPTLGAITDFKEMYGLPVFGPGNLGEPLDIYPANFGGERHRAARRAAGSGHASVARPAGAARAAGRSAG
jgi:hypothetical protein